MPKSNLYRTDRSVSRTSSISAGTFIPYNSVLFCFSSDWDNNSPKDTNLKKYYRRFNEILYDVSSPFIYSSNSEISLESNTAIRLLANCDIKYYDNLFGGAEIPLASDVSTNFSGRHGYTSGDNPDALSPSRSPDDLPFILGRYPDEEPSDQLYTIHNAAHSGHQHFVSGKDINKKIEGQLIATDGYRDDADKIALGLHDWKTLGKNVLPVVPIIRDPKIDGYSKKLTYLPKDILVFAENLNNDPSVNVVTRDAATLIIPPEGDYTREDYNHSIETTTGYATTHINPEDETEKFASVPIYLVTSYRDSGVLIPATDNTFNIVVSSNGSGLHTHAGDQTDYKSTQENYGSVLGPSGYHTHDVTYTMSVNLKSKWLNGWVTLKDETPIANGIIIGFSPIGAPSNRSITDSSDWLPPYWHFCDGDNGTPDLRGYAIAVNMYESQNSVHDTVISSSQNLTVEKISVGESSGEVEAPITGPTGEIIDHLTHSHIIDEELGLGTPIPMPGSHGTDPNRWHTHSVYDSSTFINANNEVSNNLTESTSVNYLPPRVNLAFIMYNSAIP